MNEPSENPRRYQWPWFVAAAVILFIALAIVWVNYAANRENQQRDFNAPLPSSPTH
jgi:hypothetical protein